MKKYLLLDGRGCPFRTDDEINKVSDVGNYRVCTFGEVIEGKDGNRSFFTRSE